MEPTRRRPKVERRKPAHGNHRPQAACGAGGGNRTHTTLAGPRILSPVRLPVSPPRPGSGPVPVSEALCAAPSRRCAPCQRPIAAGRIMQRPAAPVDGVSAAAAVCAATPSAPPAHSHRTSGDSTNLVSPRGISALHLLRSRSSQASRRLPLRNSRRCSKAQDLIGGVPRRIVEATRLDEPSASSSTAASTKAVWQRARAGQRLHPDRPEQRRRRRPSRPRSASPSSKDALYMGVTCLRLRAGQVARLPAPPRRVPAAPTTGSCGRSTRSSTQRSGYFFEMNPSGLMADALFGVNGDNRAWDGIWNARVRRSEIGWTIEIEIPFRTLNFDPEQRHLGHQLPAHGPPQERGQHLDGMGAQPGAAPHDQRRPRHRHHAT